MSLLSRLEQDYITAYKAKDSLRLNVLRLLKTALKNFQVQHLRLPTEEDALDLIVRQCKQRQESITQFRAANRPELADKEAAEMEILRAYMPSLLSADELASAVDLVVAEEHASGLKDMGRVMQTLMAANKGRIDGKAASEAVKAALQRLP